MYSQEIENFLKDAGIRIGDKIRVICENLTYEGILMPRTFYNPDILVIKLSNGYNIGIEWKKIKRVEKIGSLEKKSRKSEEICFDSAKPVLSILSTGGTIASKVDYRTGGVTPAMTASDLFEFVPELREIANIKPRTILQIFSENMRLEHYEKMAKEVAAEIKDGVDGIIIAHGTDTMHYSAAALSFALQNIGIPVVFVGAQRSSDRGSTDAAVNLISSAIFACSNVAGVFICMHEGMSDDSCAVHRGVVARKLHTSRRDAFKSVNAKPVARVFWREKKIEWIDRSFVKNRDKARELELKPKFEEKVALIKIHPNFNPEIIDFLIEKKYRGLVLEGTGLGHAPEYTFEAIKRACENMIVCMTSQCIFGRINMNVYSTGRDLLKIGVVPCEMLPETAFIKLAWALGNFDEMQAKEIMRKNIVGEIVERIL
jgi:glutamyl-tRNA(Gln) amidotransferase subunit D